MENIKGKIFAGIGIVLVIAGFFVIFWLLFYQESTYYTKIDNTKVEQLSSGDMRYEYTLNAYNKNGNSKFEIIFSFYWRMFYIIIYNLFYCFIN